MGIGLARAGREAGQWMTVGGGATVRSERRLVGFASRWVVKTAFIPTRESDKIHFACDCRQAVCVDPIDAADVHVFTKNLARRCVGMASAPSMSGPNRSPADGRLQTGQSS